MSFTLTSPFFNLDSQKMIIPWKVPEDIARLRCHVRTWRGLKLKGWGTLHTQHRLQLDRHRWIKTWHQFTRACPSSGVVQRWHWKNLHMDLLLWLGKRFISLKRAALAMMAVISGAWSLSLEALATKGESKVGKLQYLMNEQHKSTVQQQCLQDDG